MRTLQLAVLLTTATSVASFFAPRSLVTTPNKGRAKGLTLATGSSKIIDGDRVVLRDKATRGEATIYLHGGCVASYKRSGHEVLAVRKDAVFDGSKPVAGGLQICWPQFGPGAIQQHGFARNLKWEVDAHSAKSPEATLVLRPSEESKKIWDHPFELLLHVKLNPDHLHVKLTVKNTGAEAWDFTGALHSYFGVSHVQHASIQAEGLKGATFIDKTKNPPEEVKLSGNLEVNGFLEGVLPNFKGPVTLVDVDMGHAVSLEHKGGWHDYILWNPYGNENMGYEKFVCVESGAVSAPVTVPANGQWIGDLKIVPGKLGV